MNQLSALKKMYLIRYFEEAIEDGFKNGNVAGTCHLCAGQEATAVGTCMALANDDLVTSNHRGHGHAIAKGVPVTNLMSEIYGKATGVCNGKGGTQHITFPPVGFLGSNGITGGGIAIATGAALALKMKNKKNVVVSFFGDGATNQGIMHESLNLASLWELPVIYVCENNLYAMSTPVHESSAETCMANKAKGYKIESKTIDGNDLNLVYNTLLAVRENVLASSKPFFIEMLTYRHLGHSKSDMRMYRTKEEEQSWIENNDPIIRLRDYLIANGIAKEQELEQVKNDAFAEIEEAVKYAISEPVYDAEKLLL